MRDVPALLRDAARETLQELQALSAAHTYETAQTHAELFRRYRDELQELFLLASVLPEPEPVEDPEDLVPIRRRWDGVRFRQEGRDTLDSFAALLDALRSSQIEDFTRTLTQAADDGYDRQLWMLALGGLDTGELLDSAPTSPEAWEELLRSDGFNGMDWEDRLATWTRLTQEKGQKWIQAAATSGFTWEDTLAGFDPITRAHTQHVAGLIDNEVHRAFSYGAGLALLASRRELEAEIAELWLARMDVTGEPEPRVCPVCRKKHMTVTTDRPVDDSHPGCRCIKVPVPLNFTPVAPLSFESFRQGASS